MGDHIRSKTKLGYHISTKILSILLVLILTTTAFSSMITAQESTNSLRDKINTAIDEIIGDGSDKTGDSGNGAAANAPATTTKFSDLFKELSMLKREKTPIFSVVTKYNGTETTTRLKSFLPVAIDVNGDGKKDIRVWVFRLPGIDLSPPAACIKTTFLVRRLNDDIKYGPFEIYLQYTPKIISKLSKTTLPDIRMGYQTPTGSEVPKTCIVTHKDIPHLLYPKLETTHKVAINPVSIVGKSQLNLLFSILDVENKTVQSELTIQVNHSPAVRNEISFGMSKERLIGRGQTLQITRKGSPSSNVTIIIKDTTKNDSGFIKIQNIPKKLTLSWRLSTKGHIELNTYGSGTGPVDAAVNGTIALGFIPTKGVNFRLGWDINRLTLIGTLWSLYKGKSFDLEIDAKASATLSDLYAKVPQLAGYKLDLVASSLSFKLKAGVNAGKLILTPLSHPSADNIGMDVTNLDVVLKNCTVDLQPIETPTVSITHPVKDTVISGTVPIGGTASAPSGKEIKSVKISMDDGGWIDAVGTTSWSYNLDTTTLLNGNHTIYAKSSDGEYESLDQISVTVDNAGKNWYPLVDILTPTQSIVSGVVNISGTASDKDGTVSKVQISKDGGKNWIDTIGTTSWYYNLDTSNLGGGKYIIKARSFDGTDYTLSAYTNSTYKAVFVRFCDALDFNLAEASVDITNLDLKGVIPLANITDISVSSFVASGSGSLKVGKDAISLEVSGSLDIQNTSIYATNKTSKTIALLDNFTVNFDGYALVELSNKIKVKLQDVSLYIHADAVLDLGKFSVSLKGTGAAELYLSKATAMFNLSLDASSGIDIKNLNLEIGGFIIRADSITGSGTADLRFVLNGLSCKCNIIVKGLEIHGLYLAFNDLSKYIDFIGGDSQFGVELSANFDIETGDNWIRITIGGKGEAHVWMHTNFTVNGTQGHLDADVVLKTGNDPLVIYLYNLSGEMGIQIDGSAVVNLSEFHLWYGDKLDLEIPGLVSIAFTLNATGKEGNMKLMIVNSEASLNLNKLNLNPEINNLTISGELSLHITRQASGTISAEWNESGIIFDVDYSAHTVGSLTLDNFIFKNDLVNVSVKKIYLEGELNTDLTIDDNSINLTSDGGFANVTIENANILANSQIFTSDITGAHFIGTGSFVVEYKDNNLTAKADFVGDSRIVIDALWAYLLNMGISASNIVIQGPTIITILVNSSEEIPFTLTINTENNIDVGFIYAGSLEKDLIELSGLSGGSGKQGSFVVGANFVEHGAMPYPFIGVNGLWKFARLDIPALISGLPLYNISINGSASIEIWLDIVGFSWFYIRGNVEEPTTLSFLDKGIDIVLDPGRINLYANIGNLFNNFSFIAVGSIQNWITIRIPNVKEIKLKGAFDAIGIGNKGKNDTFDYVLDLKNFEGAIVTDSFRVVGQAKGKIEFGGAFNLTSNPIKLNLDYLDISGNISAVVQFKFNGTGWIPVLPGSYTTDGSVALLVDDAYKDYFEKSITGDNVSARLSAWYTPPFDFDSGNSQQMYKYNFSFGDGTYYEITTDKTEVFAPSHIFQLGLHNVKVTVSLEGYEDVEDNATINVVKGSPLGTSPPTGEGIVFNSDGVGPDGRFHYSFKIINTADKQHPYTLHWKASVGSINTSNGKPKDDIWYLWDMDNWTFTPSSGILNASEEVVVNVSFPPPTVRRDIVTMLDAAWIFQEDAAGGNNYYSVYMLDGLVNVFPTDNIFLPRFNPGDTINTSIWVRNAGHSTLNWTITEQPSNGTWTFNPTNGTIPAGGGQTVMVTLHAPDQYGVDLSGNITITNADNTSDYDSVFVNAITKQKQDSGILITENENNVSIRIGGKPVIHLRDFHFEINKIKGLINGNYTFNTGNNSYLWINWTKGKLLETLSFEGNVNYSIEQFRFVYGDNVSIKISRVITGAFKFREGRSGNFSLAVDKTFADVDIKINLGAPTNLTLIGNLNVDVSNNCNGTLWIDWDLTGDKPNVSFGGDLSRDGTFDFKLTDFKFKRDKFIPAIDKYLDYLNISADEISINGSGGTIRVSSDYININSGIDKFTLKDFTMDINITTVPLLGGSLYIAGMFNLDNRGNISITWKEHEYFTAFVDHYTSLDLNDVYISWITNETQLMISLPSLYLSSGRHPSFVKYANMANTFMINGSSNTTFELDSFHMEYKGVSGLNHTNLTLDVPVINIYVDRTIDSQIQLEINLTSDQNNSGGGGGGGSNNSIIKNSDIFVNFSIENITVSGSGTIYISINSKEYNISGKTSDDFYLNSGPIEFSMIANTTIITKAGVGLKSSKTNVTKNNISVVVSLTNLNISGLSYIKVNKMDLPKLEISVGSLELNDFQFVVIGSKDNTFTAKIDSISAHGTGSLSILPKRLGSNNTYMRVKLDIDDLVIEIIGINITQSLYPKIPIPDYMYVNGSGDAQLEVWDDFDGDLYMRFESENGFHVSSVIFGGNGTMLKIERTASAQGNMSPGYISASFDIGDGDGYIALDSSNMTFENVMFTFFRNRLITRGIRLSSSDGWFDANGYSLQWDNLIKIGNIYIPYNWYRMGDIDCEDINVDIIKDGDSWYHLDLPPFADVGGPYSGYWFVPIQFDASHSFDVDGNIVEYDWKFFDLQLWQNNLGPTPTYTYLLPGTYAVKVRVWDDNGNFDIGETTVRVYV